jgi:nitrogen fixation-related uncharacterized protein
MYACPQCEAEINTSTELCPHCGADLTADGQPAAPAVPKPLRKILMRWAILLGIIAVGLWSFLWFVMPSQHGDSTAQAESRAASALANLHSALASYAAAQTGGSFPNSLEPLGEASRSAVQLAQSEGYQIQYTPAPPGPDSAIRSYALQARAGNFGFHNFMTDESGVIHATKENRAATTQDPPL